MSKRVRTLLIGGIAVAALAALLAVLLVFLPEEEPGDDTDTDTSTIVTLVDKGDDESISLSSVAVTVGGETYTLEANDDGDLLVKGWEDLPHDSSALAALWEDLEIFVADRTVVESTDDPAQFGLDEDSQSRITVNAVYSDGSVFDLQIGDAAPSGDGYYIREVGKDPIYLIDEYSVSSFLEKATYYLSKTPITTPVIEEEDDEVVIRDAELSGSVRPQTIYFEATEALKTETGISVSPSGYMIKKPYYRAVSSASPLMEYTAFSGLTAEDIAAVYPTAVQLREYGFGDPYSACTFNLAVQRTNTETDENGEEVYTFSYYNVFKYTVKLGNENEDGLRYAVVYAEDELFPVVYLVDESGIEWADAQYDDMADTLLFYIHIVSVERMTLTLDGTTTTFELTHTPSEDGTSTDLAVTAGGTAYDDDEFRDVYTGLMGMYRTGKADGVPAGSPVLTVSIESNTASVQDVQIKLYQQSASKYTVVQSTGEIYSVNAKTVEAFLDQYRAFLGDMVEEF